MNQKKTERNMTEDMRCCGNGACIIDPDGRCWCGQQWDGEKMCRAPLAFKEDQAGTDQSSSKRVAATGDK
jgi:hypothetical protein